MAELGWPVVAYKTKVNCTNEGTNCKNDGIRHAQLLEIPLEVTRQYH